MARMFQRVRANPKAIAGILLPLAILIALILATGAGNPFNSESKNTSSGGPPTAGAQPTPAPEAVQANLAVHVKRVHGTTWQFDYTVDNGGKTPIAGFQLDSTRANLYNVYGKGGWATFGNGICGGAYPHILVYWSTGSSSPSVLRPGTTVHFGFTVQTSRPASMLYSLSWGNAGAQFGTTQGPAPSSQRAQGPCK